MEICGVTLKKQTLDKQYRIIQTSPPISESIAPNATNSASLNTILDINKPSIQQSRNYRTQIDRT